MDRELDKVDVGMRFGCGSIVGGGVALVSMHQMIEAESTWLTVAAVAAIVFGLAAVFLGDLAWEWLSSVLRGVYPWW